MKQRALLVGLGNIIKLSNEKPNQRKFENKVSGEILFRM